MKTLWLPPELESAISVYGHYRPHQNAERPFYCIDCARNYRKLCGLIGHCHAVHQDTISKNHDVSPDKPFQCSFSECDKSYLNAGGLAYHLENGHFPGLFSDPIPKESSRKRQLDTKDSSERMLVCPHADCNKQYKTVNGLAYHLKKGKLSGHSTSSQAISAEDELLESLMADKRRCINLESMPHSNFDVDLSHSTQSQRPSTDWSETHSNGNQDDSATTLQNSQSQKSKRKVNARPLYRLKDSDEQRTHNDILSFLQSMIQQRTSLFHVKMAGRLCQHVIHTHSRKAPPLLQQET
ncbi:hypothetical protein BDEG_26640 [Batrachochytrium dendrobatidis JEL423]|uniref:C2H2-type domain-containing protein n=1 Tax=Batrachochytrium dendrobatidis (strain JEL423) TaxID=403673 RepID=A0A177WT00_BATDL|nr:hypothetical protein BDEG_26640 [Batrachochytrium dendrobatidis JEL423]